MSIAIEYKENANIMVLWKHKSGRWIIDGALANPPGSEFSVIKVPQKDFGTKGQADKFLIDLGYTRKGPLKGYTDK